MPTNSAQTLYENQRYELIKQLEEGGHENPEVYLDGAGIPTMGVGFNLLVPENVIEILSNGFGISDRILAQDLQAEALAIKSEYDAAISAYKVANPKTSAMTDAAWNNNAATSALGRLNASNSNHMSPQERLDAIFQAAGNTGQFIIQPSATETAAQKIRNIFDVLIEDYEITLSNRIGISTLVNDYSNEHLALISLEYNNGNLLIGNDLKGALSSADRFEAWYQIRYQSNRYSERGIAKRRYLEADLFGLFSSATPTDTEAKTVIDAFLEQTHFAKISSVELNMSKVIGGVNVAQMANRDYGALSFVGHIPNFGEIFKPITRYLLERFNPDGEDITHLANTINGEVMLGILNAQGEIASSVKGDAVQDKNDLLIAVEDKSSTLVGGFGNDILIGNDKGDLLDGGVGNDYLVGNGGIDTLTGGEGDDILDGGTGNDMMSGGSDNDTYYVDSLLDVIVENAGEGDADTLISSIDYALTDGQYENIENFALDSRYGGSGLLLAGNESDNILTGNQLDNIILGGNGADTLYGGKGNDHLESGEEDVYGEGKLNVLQGGEDNDTLIGGHGVDLLYGGTGDDSLFIDKGGLYASSPVDLNYQKLGTEVMNGGEGFDTYYVGTASNYAIIEDSDGQGEVYVKADGIGDKTHKLTGGTFWGEQTITETGLPADGYTLIHADGTASQLTVAYEGDGSRTLIAFGVNIPNFYNGMLGINLVGGRVDTDFHPAEQVLKKINFDEQFSPEEVDRIKSVIRNAYEQSPIARKMFNDFTVVGGNEIKINFSENGFSSDIFGRDSSTDVANSDGEPGLSIDLNWLENNTYISTKGKAVEDTLEAALIHELVHLMTGLTDESTPGEQGVTVEFANSIYREMGIAEQASYSAYDSTGNTHTTNFEYTQGQAIDRAFTLLSENSTINDLDSSEGGVLNDLIIGNERNNVINGGDGNDFLYGGDGNDILKGDKGWGGHEGVIESHDVLFGEGGDDTLEGGEGNDVLYGGSGNDKVLGGTGNDQLIGGKGNDLLDGEVGYNKYIFSKGDGQDTIGASRYRSSSDELVFTSEISPKDVVFAREGINLVFRILDTDDKITIRGYFDTTGGYGDFVQVTFANGTIWSAAYINSSLLQGTEADDNIVGFDSDDVIEGLGGNDVIDGQDGDDTLLGGLGDDNLKGGRGNDIVEGGNGNDTLDGGDGNDVLIGGRGNDIINVGSGENTIYFAKGDGQDIIPRESVWSSSSRYNRLVLADDISSSEVKISRSEYDLVVEIYGTNDKITFELYFYDQYEPSLNEIVLPDGSVLVAEDIQKLVIQGTDGDDYLYGDHLDDVIDGGAGDDRIAGGSGDDVLKGSSGKDTMFGGDGNDLLIGGSGNDELQGGQDNDQLSGGAGSDYLYGGAGNDQLEGGLGNDEVGGGSGKDTYIFSAGDGKDTFSDYDSVDGNSIANQDIVVFKNIKSTDIYATQVGDDLILTFKDSTDQITIENQFRDFDRNSGVDYDIELFEFSDGVVWQANDLYQNSLKTSNADDVITAFDWADTIKGGLGNDIIYGQGGDDKLYGDEGDDILKGGMGNDLLVGGEGNDTLEGGNGSDRLEGGAGDDTLISFDDIYDKSSKILIGGKGNDTIYGSFGNDTYQFNLGDGQDRIIATRKEQAYSNFTATNDTLIFGEGIAAADLSFERHGDDILINVANGGDSITIENWFLSYTEHFLVNNFQFSDGSSLTVTEINDLVVQLGTDIGDQLIGSANDDRISGLGGDDQLFGQGGHDTLSGGNGSDYLDGGSGNDELFGDAGNDTLRGNAGDDTLIGGSGNDSYLIYSGDGHDTLDVSDGGQDNLFLQDINFDQIRFTQDGDDLLMFIGDGASQSIRVSKHFVGGESALDNIKTADGHWLNTAYINALINVEPDPTPDPTPDPEPTPDPDPTPSVGGADVIVGNISNDVLVGGAGNDTLTGGKGNDVLFGGTGDDIFIFAKGDGQDVIEISTGVNIIEFASGISWQDVAQNLSKYGDDLILKIAGGPDQITITDFFLYGSNIMSDFKFADGSNLTPSQIFGAYGLPVASATPLPTPEVTFGDLADNTMNGSSGNDILNGQSGDDILTGGRGNDTLIGGLGNDTFVLSKGDGQDIVNASGGGFDSILFKTGISFNDIASSLMKMGNDLVLGSGDSQVTITNFFIGGDYAVDSFIFESGGQLSAAQIFGAYGLSLPDVEESDQTMNLPDQRQFAEIIKGSNTSQGLFGSSDDELLLAEGGDDVLSGGAGNDTLIGGSGNDKYLFALGDGQDVINNYDTGATNTDVLSFGPGILSSQVSASRLEDDLVLKVNGTEDQVTVEGYFINNGNSDYSLASITFEDGTSWNMDDVTQLTVVPASLNRDASPLYSDNSSLDFSLNLLVQAYTTLDGDEGEEIGDFKNNRVNQLPIIEHY
jgi:Ca2+-binding RTX toxin-like protein